MPLNTPPSEHDPHSKSPTPAAANAPGPGLPMSTTPPALVADPRSQVRMPSPSNPQSSSTSPSSTPTVRNTALPEVHSDSPLSITPPEAGLGRSIFPSRGSSPSIQRGRSRSPPGASLFSRTATHPAPSPSPDARSGGHTLSFPSLPGRRPRDPSPGPTPASPRKGSPSPARLDDSVWRSATDGTDTPPNAAPLTWWGSREPTRRNAWEEPVRRKKTVSGEQLAALASTRQRVAQAARAVLGDVADVAHEALVLSVDVLELAPLPGLAAAARTLLNIWDAMQQVDISRMACLRLTERCADILFSVREEIADAGDQVADELKDPIRKLEESFTNVYLFMQKQSHRPFLKRYLKRDEILREIQACDGSLNNSLGLFSLSIQVRILKQVQANEARRQADAAALLRTLLASGFHIEDLPPALREPSAPVPPLPENALGLAGAPISEAHSTISRSAAAAYHLDPKNDSTPTASPKNTLPALTSSPPPLSPSMMSPEHIRTTLAVLRARQNELDYAHDAADLRALQRAALQTSNDADMIDVLQVGRAEMPEAIKTLQRALERELEREGDEADEEAQARAVAVATATAALNGQREVRPGPLGQSGTVRTMASVDSAISAAPSVPSVGSTSSSDWSSSGRTPRDTLDREFMEGGIDALRRLSKGTDLALPSWTITRYEVDREVKIGMGFFSDVYKGTWRGRTVAIKVLTEATPRQLFIRETTIWKDLQHRNVVPLFGASSACGDPPWFFVSPYYKHGSLVSYLKSLGNDAPIDLLKMLYEIARGMAYLHSKNVLHGDLKASNVLVDDKLRCVISDFGQSELKNEAYRISGTPLPHGTLRWQAPELMAGKSILTMPIDAYAFGICCVEILSRGSLPWPLNDDDAVRRFVLRENSRPPLPLSRVRSKELDSIITASWSRDPVLRPTFKEIQTRLKQLRTQAGVVVEEAPVSPPPSAEQLDNHFRKSPDPRPQPLPDVGAVASNLGLSLPPHEDHLFDPRVPGAFESQDQARNPIISTRPPIPSPFSRPSSLSETLTPDSVTELDIDLQGLDGLAPPEPEDDDVAETRNERRYRLTLQHDFHPSLTLPLWSPGPVTLGAVGFLEKPNGSFKTLFNAFDPFQSSKGRTKDMPSLFGYEPRVNKGSQRQDKRNAALRGYDVIQGWLSYRVNPVGGRNTVSREYSYPLHAGHRTAYLTTESTLYNYVDTLTAPKKWFRGNVDAILQIYGKEHSLQREDLFLVIGTLEAPDYAQFVSHSHPDGEVHFHVYTAPRVGEPWGEFATDHHASSKTARGPTPAYDVPVNVPFVSATKVSEVRRETKWDSVLLARLRFKPDVLEPTSL